MVRKIGLWLLAAAAVLMIAAPQRVNALDCVAPPPVEESYERYDAIVLGKVESIRSSGSFHIVRIAVLQSFKGVDETRIELRESRDWGESEVDGTYLYFMNSSIGKWETPLCAPTVEAGRAADSLAWLKDKEIPLRASLLESDEVRVGNGRSADVIAASAAAGVLLLLLAFFGYRYWRRRRGK